MLANLRLETRLAFGFGLMIVLVLLVGGPTAYSTAQLVERIASQSENNTRGAMYLGNIETAAWRLRYGVILFLAEPDAAARTAIVADSGKLQEAIEGNIARLAALERSTEEKSALAQFSRTWAKYAEARARWYQLQGDGRTGQAAAWRSGTLSAADETMGRALESLTQLQRRSTGSMEQEAAASADMLRFMMLVAAALATLAGLVSALLVSRGVVRPLVCAVEATRRVAEGDLTTSVSSKGRDETGQLLRALSNMTITLRTLVGDVTAGAHTVADTSERIAQGSHDLSRRTEQQAGTLDETAGSLQELTGTVRQNAESARRASRLARAAADAAVQGGEAVDEVANTMTSICASSGKIADITGVIDAIAFQTRILALNAAVEAARAGVHGRGFAAVAAEVRGLAHRSAAAARDIKSLVEDSAAKVDAGTHLVDAAGQTMARIVGLAKEVADIIAEITAAGQEQSSGIEQVNAAVAHMDQVLQQNALIVEEASAAADSMKEQAAALLQLVSRFKLGEDAGHATLREPAPRAAARASAGPRRPARILNDRSGGTLTGTLG